MSTVWPLAARAQQPERLRRIGVLMTFDENDSAGKANLSGFTQGLAELGWTEGRNVRMDVRWTAGNADRMRPASGNVSRCQAAHCRKDQGARHRGAAYAARHRRRGDRKMPSRPPLLTLMRSPLSRGRPKWRRWFGVDIKHK